MEQTTKHTPGPWERHGTRVYARTAGAPFVVAKVVHDTADHEGPVTAEMEANAALIAAAPALVEALRQAAGLLAVIGNHAAGEDRKIAHDGFRAARAALALAGDVTP